MISFLGGIAVGMGILWLVVSPRGDGVDRLDPPELPETLLSGDGEPELSVDHPLQTEPEYPYAIRGRVVDDEGRGVAGLEVRAWSDGDGFERSAPTDDTGRFVLASLPLGLYNVETDGLGHGGAERRGVAPDGPDVVLTIRLGNDLVGRVSAGDQPVPGARVMVGGPGIFPARHTVTDLDGRFSFEGLAGWPGLEIVALADDSGSGFRALASDTSSLNLTTSAAPALSLRVIDSASGRPVDLGVATVSAGGLHVLRVAFPLDGGEAVVRGIPAGPVFLRVRVPGFLPFEGLIQHTGEPVEVSIGRGATVRGTVLDRDGRAIAGATIVVDVTAEHRRRVRLGRRVDEHIDRLVQADGTTLLPHPYRVATDADGRFEFTGLPEGSARVTTSSDGRGDASTERFSVSADGVVDGLEIRL